MARHCTDPGLVLDTLLVFVGCVTSTVRLGPRSPVAGQGDPISFVSELEKAITCAVTYAVLHHMTLELARYCFIFG